ncbi:hypothetical protein [Streptomyces alkaliphilus]|nr:hypothetical protein [Streptomyces alkaliphilus]
MAAADLSGFARALARAEEHRVGAGPVQILFDRAGRDGDVGTHSFRRW